MRSRHLEWATLIAAVAAMCGLVWLADRVALGQTFTFDANARRALHSVATPWLTLLFQAITALGAQAVVTGVSGCAAVILWFDRRRAEALLVGIAVGGAEVLLAIIKVQFHRPRPESFFGLPLPSSYSFPSGHALLSFCAYGTLAALARSRLIRIAAIGLIMAIGVSRVYLGMHYASD